MVDHNLNVDIPVEVLENLLYFTVVSVSNGGRNFPHDLISMVYMKVSHRGKKKEKSCLTSFNVEYQRMGNDTSGLSEKSPKTKFLALLLEKKLLENNKMSKVEELKKEYLRSSKHSDEFAMGVIFAIEEISKVESDKKFS